MMFRHLILTVGNLLLVVQVWILVILNALNIDELLYIALRWLKLLRLVLLGRLLGISQ